MHHIELATLIVAIAGLVISFTAIVLRWNDQRRKAVEELEKVVKEHERSMTFEEHAKARLAVLEQTGVFMRDVLKRKPHSDGGSSVSEPHRLFPSGTFWDA